MARALWLLGGALVGVGALALATQIASPATTTRAVDSSRAGGRLVPLAAARVSPNGAFGAVRGSRKQGHCRRTYPCTHHGVDLVPLSYYRRSGRIEEDWWVRAPEDLIVDVVALDNVTPPLSGYGPGAILARGRSGVWHVFGHLHPPSLGALVKGSEIRRGDYFARVSDAVRPPHLHWELRRWRTEWPAARELGRKVGRGDIVIDPDAWIAEAA